jgi:PKHD-type hydroxylase
MKTEVKNNIEVQSDCAEFLKIRELIADTVNKNYDFNVTAQPLFINSLLVSKTEGGGYYAPHVDAHSLGEFSTTVFLSHPDSYDGGELCLLFNGQETTHKLPRGWAITYQTGVTHCVKPVIKGSRHVAVFWAKTAVPNDAVRESIRKLLCVLKLQEGMTHPKYKDCVEAEQDPIFLVTSVIATLRRHFSIGA